MQPTREPQAVQHVHERNGRESEHCLDCAVREQPVPRVRSIADLVPVTTIMSRNLTCAQRDVDIDALVKLMIERHIGCVPIVDAGRPVGIVTKLDVLEHHLDTREDAGRTGGEIMMPFTFTLAERATVAHAAAMMALEDIHHVPIVNGKGLMIGLVSSMDIVRWLSRNDGFGLAADSTRLASR